MVELVFLGTGEAFNQNRNTTAYLIKDNENTIMVDCGYSAGSALRKWMDTKDKDGERKLLQEIPNSIIFTHLHGDHLGGLPTLLVPAMDVKRTIPLKIYSDPDSFSTNDGRVIYKNGKEHIENMIFSQYGSLLDVIKNQFPLEHENLKEHQKVSNFDVSIAQTNHSMRNYALRFDHEGKKFAISGDGELTPDTKELFQGLDILIHEAFMVEKYFKGHSSIKEVVDFAKESNIPEVYLVHTNRFELQKKDEIKKIVDDAEKKGIKVYRPNDFHTLQL